jgi:hypothetical protein
MRYGFRALERPYRGVEQQLMRDPQSAVARIEAGNKGRNVALL